MPKIKPNATFQREKEMIAHFAENLHLLEPGLNTVGYGVEYPLFDHYLGATPKIDILAVDRLGDFVVLECKLEHGHPAAIGQLAGYAQFVKENNCTPSRPVRGFLICKKVSPMVWYAVKQVPGIAFRVFEYRDRTTVVEVFEQAPDQDEATDDLAFLM